MLKMVCNLLRFRGSVRLRKVSLMMNEPNTQSGHACRAGGDQECQARWNPYLVGIGLGLLSWLAFAVVNQPLGISTALSSVSSVCALPAMGAEAVAKNPYWAKLPFKWDGGMLFLVGTFLGSLISVLASRTFRWESVPATWRERFKPVVS